MAAAGGTRMANLALSFRLLSVSSPLCNASGARCVSSLVCLGTSQSRSEELCLPSRLPLVQTTRTTSFFNKLSAEQLWKGVTSVSNAGKKKGRGRGMGKAMAKNLNRGQVIGVGEENMVWPGLNAPIIRGRELVTQRKLPKDEERVANLIKLRDTLGRFKRFKIDPLERGWSGTKMGGRSIGAPDAIGEDTFEGFDTRVLEFKFVTCMTAVFGRKRRISVFVITGNGNGLGGFALAKATTVNGAIRKSKNRAGQNLLQFPLYNNHTVLHDFYSVFGASKVYVKKMPEGYGLVCHRAIRTVCQVIGIKDIYAKVEGSMCVQNVIKAFILGLTQQKTHQELAEEKKLHLVEFREENLNFPQVVASPESASVRTLMQIPKNEELDFERFTLGGRVRLQKKKHPLFFTKLPSYQVYLKSYAYRRNMEKVQTETLAREGEYRSFFTDQYPECRQAQSRWWGKM